MMLDLHRLHQVASGELYGRGAGHTTLFLVDVVHAIWGGEQHLVSLPIRGTLSHENSQYGQWLIGELERICRALGVDYRRTGAGEALLDGVTVRIFIDHGRGLLGVGNCSEVEEIPWEDQEHLVPHEPHNRDLPLFLDPETLGGSFFKFIL